MFAPSTAVVGSRRRFFAASAAGLSAACNAVRHVSAGGVTPPRRFPLIGFTKPFSTLSFDATADLVAEVGWDGVELAVRPGASTHIAPDRVEDDIGLHTGYQNHSGASNVAAPVWDLHEGLEGIDPRHVASASTFDWLENSAFAGPISQHHEYDGLGTGPEMVKHLRRDLDRLRSWLGA